MNLELLVLVSVLLLGCQGLTDPTPFQTQEVKAAPLELQPFLGSWCDSQGTIVMSLAADPSPTLRLRLPELLRLAEARFVDGEFLLSVANAGRTVDLPVELVEEDVLFIGPRDSGEDRPFVCSSGTMALSRGVSACSGRRASQLVLSATGAWSVAVEDFLIDHF